MKKQKNCLYSVPRKCISDLSALANPVSQLNARSKVRSLLCSLHFQQRASDVASSMTKLLLMLHRPSSTLSRPLGRTD